ncbi:MAG: NADH-quinone oxidoreductase subunit L [Chloroflexi bacterium]|nr:NADH-quinone oxidoreductase subunit L [Chloroflexota bacterium]
MIQLIPLAIAFPAFGALVNAFTGRRALARWVGPGAVGAAFVVALVVLSGYLGAARNEAAVIVPLWRWMPLPGLDVNFAIRVDPLSLVMTCVVTGVGFLIHVYSTGYMAEDERFSRFFFYLNLFITAMLVLVLADNYVMMFLGWEGVGLCSYLLIGFWFFKPEAANAAKKAFIVNRIGDFAFTIAVLWIFFLFGTGDFEHVFAAAEKAFKVGDPTITWITLLLFLGAAGKSAQLPLFVWLPDAMEGPTPVSALIHAATMVTAGVYMLARSHALLALAPQTMAIVATIGALTAFFAATIALVNSDFKRVLAYSTISQLGYMFLAIGVGAFSAGIFHLTTHAFFKALMFLGAGSVMHGLHNETNIFRMGNLRKTMPITAWTFILFGAPALAGVWPWAGALSKEEILNEAFVNGFPLLWALGLLTALMTAFYVTRLTVLAFFGAERFDTHHVHPHESPLSMTVPLMVLAALSLVGGIALNGLGDGPFTHFLKPVFEAGGRGEAAVAMPGWLNIASLVVAVAGILLGIVVYVWRKGLAEQLTAAMRPLYTFLVNKWYVDELYHVLIVAPSLWLADFAFQAIDRAVIDNGLVSGAAALASAAARGARRLQTGYARSYAFMTLVGALLLMLFFLFRM